MPAITHELDVMGTVVTLSLFDEGELHQTACQDAFAAAEVVLREADRVFSTYKADSPMSRLRRGELSLGEAPPEMAEVLDLCREAREATAGWFDPWAMPDGVDPTGLVKGWAAGRALEALRASGASGALVNAAGDLAGYGGVSAHQPFKAGIVDPRSPHQLAAVITLRAALATSGTYERGAHLMNPHTRVRESAAASSSVSGPDPALCDAFATALCVGGTSVLERLEDQAGYEALLIAHDGSQVMTPGFEVVEATRSAAS